MSYTPPSYNAVDFQFVTGYDAPSYNNVNFNFQGGFVVACYAIASFSGLSVFSSAASVSGVTAFGFVSAADKYSPFSVSGNTVVGFIHANPNLNIESRTTVSFFGGGLVDSVASVPASSNAFFERYYPPPIQCSTTFTPLGGGIVATKFRGACKLIPEFMGEYQAPARSAIFSYSSVKCVGGSYALSSFTVDDKTLVYGVPAAVSLSVAEVGVSSIFAPSASMLIGSLASSAGNSTGSFYGDPIAHGIFHCSGSAQALLSGSYTSVAVYDVPDDADVVYVTTRRIEVTARNGI